MFRSFVAKHAEQQHSGRKTSGRHGLALPWPTQAGKKIAVALVATVFALLLAELLVPRMVDVPAVKVIELASPACVYRRSTNPRLGFELKANYRHEQPDFIQSYERTNRHGQRDRERDLARTPHVQRVLLLGDSVVEGYGLPEEATISAQMERLGEGRREVLNFGVSAYCTRAEIELLETKGLAFSPDIVVVIFVENDFDNFNREAFPLAGTMERPAWTEWLFPRSDLFRLACLRGNFFQFRAEAYPVEWNQEAIGDNNVAEGFARLSQLATQHRFQPLIAIWPRFQQHEVVDVHFLPDSDQLVVEALAAEYQLPTVRLSQAFREHTTPNPRLRYSQGDELHPSAEGAQLAAEALHALLERGLEKQTPTPSRSDPEVLSSSLATLQAGRPNYARVFNRLGNDCYRRGDYQAALVQYEKALAEDPQNAATYNNLGVTLESLDRTATAIDHFRKAIAIEPDFAEAHYNLGNALAGVGDTQAQAELIQAVQLKPDFVAAHFRLARLLLEAGRTRAGTMGLRRVVALDPAHVDALNRLAEELAKQQQFGEARQWFRRVVDLDPQHADAWNNLGALSFKVGDLEAARAAFAAAVEANPEHPTAARNLQQLDDGANLPDR